MELILAAACCSVIVSILLKFAKAQGFDALHMIVWNYASASVLCFLWFKPDLQHVSIINTPWWLIVALGILLPSAFLCLARSLQYAGTGGLGLLTVLTGLSDITPFILNLLTNNSQVLTEGVIVTCILQAITSNLIVNMVYAFFFSGKRKEMLPLFYKRFFIIIVGNLLLLGGYYLWS